MIRVELNRLLIKNGFDAIGVDERIKFNASDDRAKYVVIAENKCKKGNLHSEFPGLGSDLLRQEWNEQKSAYLRLGELKSIRRSSSDLNPMNYKFDAVARIQKHPSMIDSDKNYLKDSARFDYIMLDIAKSEDEYISEYSDRKNR